MTIKNKVCVVFLMGIACLLCLASFLYMSGFPFASFMNQSDIHARSAYDANWGIQINEKSKEEFFTESDHAFGEGQRYSVLSGHAIFGIRTQDSEPHMQYAKTITQSTGFGEEEAVNEFLTHIYDSLNVPEEERCPLQETRWIKLSKEDGSMIVVSTAVKEGTEKAAVYIAEELY